MYINYFMCTKFNIFKNNDIYIIVTGDEGNVGTYG